MLGGAAPTDYRHALRSIGTDIQPAYAGTTRQRFAEEAIVKPASISKCAIKASEIGIADASIRPFNSKTLGRSQIAFNMHVHSAGQP